MIVMSCLAFTWSTFDKPDGLKCDRFLRPTLCGTRYHVSNHAYETPCDDARSYPDHRSSMYNKVQWMGGGAVRMIALLTVDFCSKTQSNRFTAAIRSCRLDKECDLAPAPLAKDSPGASRDLKHAPCPPNTSLEQLTWHPA